jgi:hypothetical protein
MQNSIENLSSLPDQQQEVIWNKLHCICTYYMFWTSFRPYTAFLMHITSFRWSATFFRVWNPNSQTNEGMHSLKYQSANLKLSQQNQDNKWYYYACSLHSFFSYLVFSIAFFKETYILVHFALFFSIVLCIINNFTRSKADINKQRRGKRQHYQQFQYSELQNGISRQRPYRIYK